MRSKSATRGVRTRERGRVHGCSIHAFLKESRRRSIVDDGPRGVLKTVKPVSDRFSSKQGRRDEEIGEPQHRLSWLAGEIRVSAGSTGITLRSPLALP